MKFKSGNTRIYWLDYPFGMVMPGREYAGGDYKFGFNNQETIHELCDIYEFEFRLYNSKSCRFFSVDPLASNYSWNSTYAFCENRVIDGIDLEGKEWEDSKGNFIFVMSSIDDLTVDDSRYMPGQIIPKNDKIVYHSITGYVFIGTGIPVQIQIVQSAHWLSDGQEIDLVSEQRNYNCHGLTTLDRLALVDSENGNSEKLLKDKAGIDILQKLTDHTSKDFNKIKNGDIVVFVNPNTGVSEHSAIFNGTTGKYTSKNGLNNESEYSLEELKNVYKQATEISYFTPSESKVLINTENAIKHDAQTSAGFLEYKSIKKAQKDIKKQSNEKAE